MCGKIAGDLKENGSLSFPGRTCQEEGAIAGPRVLEHIINTYLKGSSFTDTDFSEASRIVFGATSEVGVFEMGARGMEEVANPSEAFLAERQVNAPGAAIAVTLEGTRPLQ